MQSKNLQEGECPADMTVASCGKAIEINTVMPMLSMMIMMMMILSMMLMMMLSMMTNFAVFSQKI